MVFSCFIDLKCCLQGTSYSQSRHVEVVLLSGQRLDVICEPNTTARQVFEMIVTHMGLPEHYFFGITYMKGQKQFFDLNKIAREKQDG